MTIGISQFWSYQLILSALIFISEQSPKCIDTKYCTCYEIQNNHQHYICEKPCVRGWLVIDTIRTTEGIKMMKLECAGNYSQPDYIKLMENLDVWTNSQVKLLIENCPLPNVSFIEIFNIFSPMQTITDFTFTKARPIRRWEAPIFERYHFAKLQPIRFLNLSYNSIEELPEELFVDMINLESLYLGGNRLQNLPLKIFEPLKALKILDLSENRFTTISGKIFEGLSGLQNLSLRANKLDNLPPWTFNSLTELRDLQIAENNMTIVRDGTFDNLKQLKFLNISHNLLYITPNISMVDIFKTKVDDTEAIDFSKFTVSDPW